MSQGEQAVNDDLRALGDAYRLGQIARAEYRSRRRHLLSSAIVSDVETARNPIAASPQAAAQSRPGRAAPQTAAGPVSAPRATIRPYSGPSTPASPPRKSGFGWLQIAGLVIVMVVLAGVGFAFLMTPSAKNAKSASSQTPAAPDPAAALDDAATQFVDNGRWTATDIEAFLRTWNAAGEVARKDVIGRPSFVHLREQLAYNIRVTKVLLDDAAPDSSKIEQAKALDTMDQELNKALH